LRNHPDVGLVAAVVAEPIEAQAIVEIAEKRDVVFEHDIGPSAAAASPAATAPAATHPRASATPTAHSRWPWNACPGTSCTWSRLCALAAPRALSSPCILSGV